MMPLMLHSRISPCTSVMTKIAKRYMGLGLELVTTQIRATREIKKVLRTRNFFFV